MAKGDIGNGVFGDVLRQEEAKKQGGARGGKGGGKGPQDAPADAFDALAPKDPDAPKGNSSGGGRVKLKDW